MTTRLKQHTCIHLPADHALHDLCGAIADSCINWQGCDNLVRLVLEHDSISRYAGHAGYSSMTSVSQWLLNVDPQSLCLVSSRWTSVGCLSWLSLGRWLRT